MSEQAQGRPLVTIGIPTYNSAEYVARSVASALAQTYELIEVVVVDDASTDGTADVVRGIDDPRLRLVVNERNLGLAGNHNRVIELAASEYVKVLHADDLIVPDAIERQARALAENPGVVLVTSKRTIIDSEGKRLTSRGPKWPEGARSGEDVLHEIVRAGRNLLGEPSAALFRRDAALRAGGFSADWPYMVDLEFCARLLREGDLYFIDDELAAFRVSGGQQSAKLWRVQAEDGEKLFRHIQADYGLGLSEAEVESGIRVARRDALLRRVLYGILAIPATTRERVSYVIAGGWNTAFSYLVFALLWWAFGDVWPYWLVLVLTSVAGTLNGFVTQRQFVFRSQGRVLAEFARFSLVYVVIAVLNIAAFPALVRTLQLDPYLSQALFTLFVVIAGYVANKYFSFRQPLGAQE